MAEGACLASLWAGTLGTVIKPLYDGLIKHAIYPFSASRNIKKLEIATETLIESRNDRCIKIESEKWQKGLIATREAKNWLQRADKAESDLREICGRYDQRRGIVVCCFQNCWSSYKISKQAAKMLTDVNECKREKPHNVTVEPPPPSIVHTPVYSVPLPSRVTQLQEAIDCVKNDPAGVIEIWGLGGVGKTHLLKEMNNSFSDDTFFDCVIFVTASKGCSVEKIQAEIAKKLTLREDDDVESQANIIFDFLNMKSFLILLDDIWDRINLQTVGIPYPFGSADQIRRKVVLTTRSKEVCGLMEVRKYINVTCLPDDEAWHLFKNKVGQETLSSSPRIEVLAKQLVNQLKGLPLALITIGWPMHPRTEPVEWQSAVDYMMKNSCCHEDDPLSMESVFRRLKFSYDSLRNDTLKQCFLSCSLWPEDMEITMEDLVQCWMGLSLVDEGDIHSSYSKAYRLVCELKAACLLESCKRSSSTYLRRNFRPHRALSFAACVKMHDVVRDLAIWISSGHGDENSKKWVVRAGEGVNTFRNTIPWSKAECVSLMWSNITEFPPFSPNDCSIKLRTLYLQGNSLDERSIGAIQNFSELKCLDLSFNHLRDIPEELCALGNLEYLNLSGNDGITEVPLRLAELTKLRFLSLGGTGIEYIPTEVISSNKHFQVLDLITLGGMPSYNTISIIKALCTLTALKAVDIAIGSDDVYGILCDEVKLPIRDLLIQKSIKVAMFCLSGDIFSYDIPRRTLYELTINNCPMKQIILGHELAKSFDALSLLVLHNLRDLEEIKWWNGTLFVM